MSKFKASLIISTFNQPEWLKKVLWSYEIQTKQCFEIIIADDGSTNETKQVIDKFIVNSHLKIKHIWQEDKGFGKSKILNKAIAASSSNYLIFTDGDCIARQDLVERHLALNQDKHFLSGGYFKLPKGLSHDITKQDIIDQSCYNVSWLLSKGVKKTFKLNKISSHGFKEWFLNTFTPTKATWDGCNVSGWKKDILKVNGFDERMEYGGEDREIGERLFYLGIKGIQVRYSLICVHLHHDRPYKNVTAILKNKKIRKETKKTRSIYTDFGIVKK